jgi:hypothetical protein
MSLQGYLIATKNNIYILLCVNIILLKLPNSQVFQVEEKYKYLLTQKKIIRIDARTTSPSFANNKNNDSKNNPNDMDCLFHPKYQTIYGGGG